MTNRRSEGAGYEELALNYLIDQGYKLLKRNFHFGRAGEIDLVMKDGETYVFVEVKARRSHTFGTPEEAVTLGKRKQIRRVAEGFVHVHKLIDYTARFDVVAIDFVTGKPGEPEIRHHIDAFR